ncbi:N-acetylglucosamine-6-phosphate deacetylase [Rhodobacteraceae bacterium RKSG542]|uniref:N-acetylglucosamine-6-phosphate deacetylase n=1 Tax=Pseudovibrio flavus TaxID=2529854 RepID=UPI0012BBD4B9|nr:N-acetylglucosamine-6-phosphate deacetylase [Pseudovibrio flavus]MTI16459.1 N-acetylglucosamine-6-phosphate deacetylase [Pseudovibrio flavus]
MNKSLRSLTDHHGCAKAQQVSLVFARTLYDGSAEAPISDQLIWIEGEKIVRVEPSNTASAMKLGAHIAPIVAPGFIDIQINGALDVQFNDMPTKEAVAAIAAGARQGGTAYCMPTFITAEDSAYTAAIEAADAAIRAGEKGVLGLHLEGPFLSPRRPGIHPPGCIRTLEEDDLERLCAPFSGKLLITLAPECQKPQTIKRLVSEGRIVFAGHSQATHKDMQIAMEEGLSGATHLFNAMSQIEGREPGVVGTVVSSGSLYAGIIADGYHVHPQNIKMTAKLMPDHLCLVTDAMQTLAGKTTEFFVFGNKIYLNDGRLTDAAGTLAGAHLAMDEALRKMIDFSGVSVSRAIKMASTNPASALGLASELGHVKEGYRAGLTLLSDGLEACGTVVDGTLFS